MVIVYEAGDMLTADELADHFGYSRDAVRSMLSIRSTAADPRLIRLKIDTTPEWRKSTGNRARFVFAYEDVKRWYEYRERRTSVKAQRHRRTRQPSPIL